MRTVTIEDPIRIKEIIKKSDICFVGITDLEGHPYVLPMNFGYHDDAIYLHSGPEGSKLEMLHRDNHVCLTFCSGNELVYQNSKIACSYSMRSESAMCRGKVSFIEAFEEKRQGLDIIMRHYTDNDFRYSDPAIKNVKVWKVEIEQLSGKIFGLRGNEKP